MPGWEEARMPGGDGHAGEGWASRVQMGEQGGSIAIQDGGLRLDDLLPPLPR